MRVVIVIVLVLLIAYWVDARYFDSMFSRETGDMIEHIVRKL